MIIIMFQFFFKALFEIFCGVHELLITKRIGGILNQIIHCEILIIYFDRKNC